MQVSRAEYKKFVLRQQHDRNRNKGKTVRAPSTLANIAAEATSADETIMPSPRMQIAAVNTSNRKRHRVDESVEPRALSRKTRGPQTKIADDLNHSSLPPSRETVSMIKEAVKIILSCGMSNRLIRMRRKYTGWATCARHEDETSQASPAKQSRSGRTIKSTTMRGDLFIRNNFAAKSAFQIGTAERKCTLSSTEEPASSSRGAACCNAPL